MSQRNRIIMGTALGIAAVAIAIDHTRHRLPEPITENADASVPNNDAQPLSPCSLGDAPPCSLGGKSPCSL
jgi:hypothetical protein